MRMSKVFDYLSKRKAPHVRHTLWYISLTLSPLHDYDVKSLNTTFYEGREHTTTKFPFSFCELG